MQDQISPASPTPDGCAYVVDAAASPATRFCNARRRPGSAYCPEHHTVCYLASGSTGERGRLREIEALASAVGGKRGRAAPEPPAPLLRRLERTASAASASRSPPQGGAPTAERLRHGTVERLERAIADSAGHPARPYRAVDTLAMMQ